MKINCKNDSFTFILDTTTSYTFNTTLYLHTPWDVPWDTPFNSTSKRMTMGTIVGKALK